MTTDRFFLRIAPWLVCLFPFAGISRGAETDVKEVPDAAVVDSTSPRLEFTFVAPGWMMGLDGTLGVKGLETGVSAGFDDIVKNLDMIGAGSLEGRNGKFGFILEGLYFKTSVASGTPGPLLSTVSLTTEMALAEGTLTYRFLENDRAWLEFLAGARYIYLGGELSLNVDSAGVREASEALSQDIIDRATTAASEEVSKRLPGIISRLDDEKAELRAKALGELEGRVHDRVEEIREKIRDIIDGGIGSPGPGLGAAIADRGPVRDIIRDYVKAKVAAEVEAARAQLSAAVAEARARVRREAEKRLAKAEARLAKAIEKEISGRIAKSPVTGSRDWVDPFVGFRGRCQLFDAWYAVARGDLGGFGVSSDLTWNLYAAIGFEFSKRTSLELGYRYFDVDYRSGDFSCNMAVKGPFAGVRIDF